MSATPAIDLDALLRRLHLPTVRRLYPDLATRAETEALAYREYLAILMAEEVAHRAQTRIQRCVRRARFPFLKTIDEFDFTFQSAVRLSLLGSALGPEFVTGGHSLVLSGPSGTGKTHLAVAVAIARFRMASTPRLPRPRPLSPSSRSPLAGAACGIP